MAHFHTIEGWWDHNDRVVQSVGNRHLPDDHRGSSFWPSSRSCRDQDQAGKQDHLKDGAVMPNGEQRIDQRATLIRQLP